jgi:ATP-binding cassette subfamily C protein CydC
MNTTFRLATLFASTRNALLLGAVLSLVTLLAGIALLALSGWFITAMGLAGLAGVSMNYFTPAASIRGLSIMRSAGRYGERLVSHEAALKLSAQIRLWFYDALSRVPFLHLKTLHSGDAFTRLKSDIDAVEKCYLLGYVPVLSGMAALTLLGVILAFYQPALAIWILLLVVCAGICAPLLIQTRNQKDAKDSAAAQAELANSLTELLQGLADQMVFDPLNLQLAELHGHERRWMAANNAINRRDTLLQTILLIATGMALLGTLIILTPSVLALTVTGPQLAMACLLSIAAFDIALLFPAALQSLQQAHIAARRLFALTDAAITEAHISPVIAPFLLECRNVSFGYSDKAVLRNIDLTLKSGQVLAITGRSGTGKSTLLELLSGELSAQSGTITRSGIIAHAPQKPYFMADTIAANMLIANPDATVAMRQQAYDLVGLTELIDSLKDGENTYLGENGARLSGGQLRRLAIARAWLHQASCLMLDEPEEGLDHALTNKVLPAVIDAAIARGQAVILGLHDTNHIWCNADWKILALD